MQMAPKSRSPGLATRRLQAVDNAAKSTALDEKAMSNWIKGYKLTRGTNASFYGKLLYSEGNTFKIEGPLEFCKNGLHFSRDPLHALSIMYSWTNPKVALWQVRASPQTLTADGSPVKGRFAEKCVTSELFMERRLSTEERDEKLTGWVVHPDKDMEYFRGAIKIAEVCQEELGPDGWKRVTLLIEGPAGLSEDLHEFEYIIDRDSVDAKTFDADIVELKATAERYGQRMYEESKQDCGRFQFIHSSDRWRFDGEGHHIVYTTPVDDSHYNFIDKVGQRKYHVRSISHAVILLDQILKDSERERERAQAQQK